MTKSLITFASPTAKQNTLSQLCIDVMVGQLCLDSIDNTCKESLDFF